MAVNFGRQQLKNPTPANVNSIIAVFTVIAGCILTWLGTPNFIPSKYSTILQSVLGLLITIANAIKPFFGVVTNGQTVNITDVTAMESEPTQKIDISKFPNTSAIPTEQSKDK